MRRITTATLAILLFQGVAGCVQDHASGNPPRTNRQALTHQLSGFGGCWGRLIKSVQCQGPFVLPVQPGITFDLANSFGVGQGLIELRCHSNQLSPDAEIIQLPIEGEVLPPEPQSAGDAAEAAEDAANEASGDGDAAGGAAAVEEDTGRDEPAEAAEEDRRPD